MCNLLVVVRVQEVHPVFVLLMVVAGGARNLAATRELKTELPSARHMEADHDVNSSGARRVQKDAQISIFPKVEGSDAIMIIALDWPEGSLDYASSMAAGRAVRGRTALEVQKVHLDYASLMVVPGDANILLAQKEHNFLQRSWWWKIMHSQRMHKGCRRKHTFLQGSWWREVVFIRGLSEECPWRNIFLCSSCWWQEMCGGGVH